MVKNVNYEALQEAERQVLDEQVLVTTGSRIGFVRPRSQARPDCGRG
jgi:hypothetical protein